MKLFFFGVKSASEKGHFLYDVNGYQVWSEHPLPFRYPILDGSLLPPREPEEQGKLHLAIINGWTILGMWDRTADKRGGCNCSFIAEVLTRHIIVRRNERSAEHCSAPLASSPPMEPPSPPPCSHVWEHEPGNLRARKCKKDGCTARQVWQWLPNNPTKQGEWKDL